MSVDAYGRVAWDAAHVTPGTYNWSVTATDPFGAAGTKAYAVQVVADTTPPVAVVTASAAEREVNQVVRFYIDASDNVGVTKRTLAVTLGGTTTELTLDAAGQASFTPGSAGVLTATAYAYDAANNVSDAATAAVLVLDPAVERPLVGLDPVAGGIVTAPTSLHYAVTLPAGSTATVEEWRLEYRPSEGNGPWTAIATGTGVVPAGTAAFDPTLLANGAYTVRVWARTAGGSREAAQSVTVDGRLKLGNMQQSATDLTIPVAGIPISVGRVYDSLTADKSSDFGYGWTLNIGAYRAEVDRATTDDFGNFLHGTRVVLRDAAGHTMGYTFRPRPYGSFSSTFVPAFVADPGVYLPLELVGSGPMYLSKVSDDRYLVLDDGGDLDLNPNDAGLNLGYAVTEPVSGLVTTIDARTGQTETIENRQGTKLTVTPDGVVSNRGRAVAFERDYQNRIVRVTDPRGNSVRYDYSPAGDLASVTDRTGVQSAAYGYYTDPAHYLKTVTDALGVEAMAVTYDATTKRLSDVVDVNGTRAQFEYIPAATAEDPERMKQTITRNDNDPLTPDPTAEVAFDKRGNVLRAFDPVGIQDRFTYDNYNRPTKMTRVVGAADTDPGRPLNDPDDRATQILAFDFYNGLPTYTKNPTGAESFVVYDKATGLPTSTTDAQGNTTHSAYDAKGHLYYHSTAEGITNSFTYDPRSGDLISATRNGVTSTLAYDTLGQVKSVSDDRGNVVERGYDANGNQTTTTRIWVNPGNANDVRRFVSETKYDANDRAIEEYGEAPEGTPYANRVKTTTAYDLLGRAYRTTDGHGNVSTTIFDARGLAVQETASDGSLTRTVYDIAGRVRWTTDPFRPGQATATILGTHTEYDVGGRVTKTERVSGLGITLTVDANGTGSTAPPTAGSYTVTSSTEAAYRASDGLTLWTRDEFGTYTRPAYDAYGRQVSSRMTNAADTVTYQESGTTHFDASGRVDFVIDPTGQKSGSVYDGDDRVIKQIAADGSSVQTHYDPEGNRDYTIDAVGQRTDFEYTPQGWLKAVLSPAVADPADPGETVRPRTQYGYDTFGNRTTITDANGRITTFIFDDRNREVGRTLPAVGGVSVSESTVYDAKWGVVDYTVDFAGTKSDTVYDWEAGSGLTTTLGRVAKVTFTKADSSTSDQAQLFTYDAFGRTATITDQTVAQIDRVTTFTYDDEGRTISVTSPEGVVEYAYDPATGRQTLMRTRATTGQPVSLEIAYSHDQLERLSTVTERVRGGVTLTAADKLVTAYGYDSLGAVESITVTKNGNAVRTTMNTYDSKRHWLTGVTNTGAGGTTESVFTYARRADGQIEQADESVRQPNGTLVDTTTTYEYDGLNRLTQEVVLHGTAVDTETSYALDLVGNRLGLAVKDGTNAVLKQVTNVYDERDQLQTETTTGTDAGTLNFGYDTNGSLTTTTKDGLLQSARLYDARGRLAELQDGSGATTATYRYGADGLRAGVTEGGTTTLYLVDSQSPSGFGQVVEERAAGGIIVAQYVYGQGLDPISVTKNLDGIAGQETALYLADGHSGVRQLINQSGAVQAAMRHDAFGGSVAKVGPWAAANSIGYRGERFDGTLGNYDLRARHYDPRTGRFTSMDPFTGNYEDVLQAMRYGYAGANPIDNSDPSGMEFSLGGMSTAMAVGVGIAALDLGWQSYNGDVTREDFVGFGMAVSDALGCPGVKAFRSMMGLPFGAALGAAVGFYGDFLAGFADALADDPNVSYEELMGDAITQGILGAIEGIMAFAFLGGVGRSACFTAGTPLLTPHGATAIDELKPGDTVLSRDEFDPTGVVEAKLVEEVFVYKSQVLYITVGGQRVGTTSEHPFFVLNQGWIKAGELQIGDVLASHDGQNATVAAIESGDWQTVYNIRVQDHHTYFVGCKEWGISVWAHNACAWFHGTDFYSAADIVLNGLSRRGMNASLQPINANGLYVFPDDPASADHYAQMHAAVRNPQNPSGSIIYATNKSIKKFLRPVPGAHNGEMKIPPSKFPKVPRSAFNFYQAGVSGQDPSLGP